MMVQIAAWLGLIIFSIAFNAHVGAQIDRRRHDFMARFVALGCFIVVAVQTAATGHWLEGALYLVAFACGGAGMAWGSWQRRKLAQDGA